MKSSIISLFILFFALSCSSATEQSGLSGKGDASQPADPYEALYQRGIIVWGLMGYQDQEPQIRWKFQDRNIAPAVAEFFMTAEGLDIDLRRLQSFGWTADTLPDSMSRLAQIDVNPSDSSWAERPYDLAFIVDKAQFTSNPEYRQQLVVQMKKKQDLRLTIEVGQAELQKKYAKKFGEFSFSVRVKHTTTLAERKKVLDTLATVLSKLKAEDLEGLSEFYVDIEGAESRVDSYESGRETTVEGKRAIIYDVIKQLVLPLKYFLDGNSEQIISDLKTMRTIDEEQSSNITTFGF